MGTGTCIDYLTCFVYNRFVFMVFCTHWPLSHTRAEIFIYLLFLFQTFWDENDERRHKIWERTQLCSWPLMWRINWPQPVNYPALTSLKFEQCARHHEFNSHWGLGISFIVPEWWQTEYTVSTWIIIIYNNTYVCTCSVTNNTQKSYFNIQLFKLNLNPEIA